MPTNIIVSYDGTNNEDDAIALGRVFVRAGAEVALAYVRHTHEPESELEALARAEAEELLKRGAALLGSEEIDSYVVSDRSTPEGLRALAERTGAEVVVFCSDSHTAQGRIGIGNSAQRLLENGPVAVAIAPAGLAQRSDAHLQRIAALGEGADDSARATAEALAGALDANIVDARASSAELLVVGSRPEIDPGRVALSAATQRVVEEASASILVLPRGVALSFGEHAVLVA